VASSEERVAKFLKRLLQHRSALEVAQSLATASSQQFRAFARFTFPDNSSRFAQPFSSEAPMAQTD